MPLAAEVKGLINLRGQIITAVDLRTQLGLAEGRDLRTIVVIRTGKDAIGLLVDEVGDVVAPSPDDCGPVPVAVPDRVRRLVTGAFKLEGRLLLVLNTERIGAA